jgi:hypothetical protein
MHLFNLFFSTKAIHILLFLVVSGGIFSDLTAQANRRNDWVLPHHHINLMVGSGAAGGVANHEYPGDNMVLGLSYTYHVTQHWFGSVDYQLISGNFDLFGKHNFVSNVPSLVNPTKVQIAENSNTYGTYSESGVKPNLYELTDNIGFSRRQNYSFNIGYMAVTHRNILRIGVGYSHSTFVGRYASTESSSVKTLLYVYQSEEQLWLANIMASYDFFINKNLTIGVRFNGLIRNNPPLNGCITVGYCPVFKNKTKQKPRV